MLLRSPAFTHQGRIPTRFTCDGEDVSPPLEIVDAPAGTVTLALVMDDPDAPMGVWTHWVAYDIPPITDIPEGVAELGTPGRNSWGRLGYGGPCPPAGTHRYVFHLFAVDTELGLPAGMEKADVLAAIGDHVIDEAYLIGLYSRH